MGRLIVAVQNIYSKMHPVSCTNTHHDVRDLVNDGIVENSKTSKFLELNIVFYEMKKLLTCASDSTFWEAMGL